MSERRLIPVTSENENLCVTNCNGACCRAITELGLDKDEVAFLEEGGAILVPSNRTEGFDKPTYLLLRDCPYLVQSPGSVALCSVYDDPRKPEICSTFTAGSEGCQTMREARFLSQPIE